MRSLPALLATVVLLPGAAAAQETRQPLQELFLTETVYPQERHELQITIGALVDRSRPDRATLMPFSVEYGLTDRWQLEGRWDGMTAFQPSALSEFRTARVSVGTKYSVRGIAGLPIHAAFGLDIEWPQARSFANGDGEHGMEIEPFIAGAADLARHLTVVGAAGLSLEPRETTNASEFRADDRGTISLGVLLPFERVTVGVEYTARSDVLPWRLDGAPLITPSITLKPNDRWEIGLGTPMSAARARRQPGFAVHVVREFQ